MKTFKSTGRATWQAFYQYLRIPLALLLFCSSAALAQAAKTEVETKAEREKHLFALLDRYLDAVNQVELQAVTDTYHFPHIRIVNNKVTIWQTPQEAMPMLNLPKEEQEAAMRDGLGPDWHHTEWEYRRLLSHSDNKAHVDTALLRYNSKGDMITRFESLYILTRENGVWAIKGRSSFAPR